MSGFRLTTSSRVSAKVVASPATSRSVSVFSICIIPKRTAALSSATTTLIGIDLNGREGSEALCSVGSLGRRASLRFALHNCRNHFVKQFHLIQQRHGSVTFSKLSGFSII